MFNGRRRRGRLLPLLLAADSDLNRLHSQFLGGRPSLLLQLLCSPVSFSKALLEGRCPCIAYLLLPLLRPDIRIKTLLALQLLLQRLYLSILVLNLLLQRLDLLVYHLLLLLVPVVDLQVFQQEFFRVLLKFLDAVLQVLILLVDVHQLHVLRRQRVLARVRSQEVNVLVSLLELLVLHLQTFHVALLFRLGRRLAVVAEAGDLVNTEHHVVGIEVVSQFLDNFLQAKHLKVIVLVQPHLLDDLSLPAVDLVLRDRDLLRRHLTANHSFVQVLVELGDVDVGLSWVAHNGRLHVAAAYQLLPELNLLDQVGPLLLEFIL